MSIEVRAALVVLDDQARRAGIDPGAPFDMIELGARVGESGAFGEVFEVDGLGPAHAHRHLLVKVFNPMVISPADAPDLAERCQVLASRLRSSIGPMWGHSWGAVPLALGVGLVEGEERVWSLMRDLRADGFIPAGDVPLRSLSPEARLNLGRAFADRMDELERVEVVHTDVCLENLVIDPDRGRVQLIDLDGVVPSGLGVAPLTPGHRDSFMPIEVKGDGRADPDLSAMNPPAERWSTAMMVGYLVLGVEPLFFLSAISLRNVVDYAVAPGAWPQIDRSSQLFNHRNQAAYEQWLTEEVPSLPSEFVAAMDRFRRAGADGGSRPSALVWARACAASLRLPEIAQFNVDCSGGPVGSPVHLSWIVTGAERVEVVGVGIFLPSESATAQLAPGPQRFEIIATNRVGEARARSDTVLGVVIPQLHRIPWPECPELRCSISVPVLRTPDYTHLVASLGNDLVVPVPSFAAAPLPTLPDSPCVMPFFPTSGVRPAPSVSLRPPVMFEIDTREVHGFEERPRPWFRRWRRVTSGGGPE